LPGFSYQYNDYNTLVCIAFKFIQLIKLFKYLSANVMAIYIIMKLED